MAPGKFPDGNQASKDEMLAAKKSVQKYNDDMDAYLNCIKSEFDAKVAAMPNYARAERGNGEGAESEAERRSSKKSPPSPNASTNSCARGRPRTSAEKKPS